MCDQIRHRGPDDEGYHVDGPCAIGMRRLSIIDLDTGRQPIPNEDETIWVVFNGEIYNYQELRQELASQGHKFRTASDTEILVHLYEEEGIEGVRKLRGMFAFCIWDSNRQQVILARDRFGKKPLYYALLPEGLYFGSELKSLQVAGVPTDIDRDALRLYFQFLYIPDPLTPFRAVRKLAAGTCLTYQTNGEAFHRRYWSLPAPSGKVSPELRRDEVGARLSREFDEAVRLRMIADVPLGAFLSGGIDSSSVVASMALQSAAPVKTFSIGFEEQGFNELPYASLVARRYRTEHHEILVRPDTVQLVERLVKHFDEPFADSSAIPTFAVSQFAAQHVKVVLSGDGGDELFGGYNSFVEMQKLRVMDRVPQVIRKTLSLVADKLPYSAYGKNYLRMISRPSDLERYFEHNYTPYYLRRRLLSAEWMLPADAAFLTRTFAECLLPAGADIVSQVMYFEATANLTGDMLVKVDRMSMANSLEVRCPLLDHRLAELAATIPNSWKIHNGRGKHVFVQALGHRLPAELLARKKMGFGVPLELWFRTSLREFVADHLTSRRFVERGIVSPPFLGVLLDEHQRGRRNNHQWIWSLLMLELWFRNLESATETCTGAAPSYALSN